VSSAIRSTSTIRRRKHSCDSTTPFTSAFAPDKCGCEPMSALPATADPADVLAFWRETGKTKWFARDPAFDSEIRARFQPLWQAAAADQLAAWEGPSEGPLPLPLALHPF